MTIQALGLGSGLDINTLVEGIVDAQRIPTTARLDANKKRRKTR